MGLEMNDKNMEEMEEKYSEELNHRTTARLSPRNSIDANDELFQMSGMRQRRINHLRR